VTTNLFDRDFLLWVKLQATLLRDGRFDALDCGNLIDVLEGIGREERLAVQTAFRNILVRFLKLAMSPARGDRIILVESITEHRNQLQTRLESTPSLMRHAPCARAFRAGVAPGSASSRENLRGPRRTGRSAAGLPVFDVGGDGCRLSPGSHRMKHRRLNHEGFTLTAINDIIARGKWDDWAELRMAVLADPALLDKVERICVPLIVDPYAQRYHFWMNYVKKRRASP